MRSLDLFLKKGQFIDAAGRLHIDWDFSTSTYGTRILHATSILPNDALAH